MQSASERLIQTGGPFDLILCDPPWKFASNSAAKPGRNAIGHYDCMPLAEIKALPVREIAAKDSLLIMWTTAPFAKLSFDVLEAWGFNYVSQLTWVKDRIGTGFWVRNRHEIVYIAKRGKFPCPKPAPFPDSVISGQQRQHSRKPDALHQMIESAFASASKLEMFARESREGWTTWGNQTTKFDAPGARAFDVDAFLEGLEAAPALSVDDFLGV